MHSEYSIQRSMLLGNRCCRFHLSKPAFDCPLINPTGPSCITAAQNRSAVLHRTQDRVGSVLLGASFTPKPCVIRANEKEIGFRPHRFPNQGRKNILVANQGPDRKSIPALFRLPNLKIERNLALTESTDRSDQFSQSRNQSERKRHVFAPKGTKFSLRTIRVKLPPWARPWKSY